MGNEVRSLADEIPFDIPDSWEWVRLGSIGETNIGLTYKPSDVTSGGVPVLRSNNIQNGQMDYSELLYVSCTVPERAYAHKGDILICARNGSRALVGKSAIVDTDDMAFGAFMAIYRSPCNPYIQLFINSYLFRGQLDGATTTTINQVTQEMLKRQLCPLPPIQEQQRIVQRYIELQPLIAAYSSAYDKVQILNAGFPGALKKSILQEAVQGKLIPQDPSDESAEALLERIRAEKQRLIKEGKIKKEKHESVIFRRDNSHYEKRGSEENCIDEEIPFDIPDSWAWCRLSTILEKLTDGTHSTPKYTDCGIPFISVKDVSSGVLSFDSVKYISEIEHRELYKRCDPKRGDILLTKVGTTGIPVIVDTDKEFSLFVSVAQLRFSHSLLDSDYLLLLIKSPLVQKQCTEHTRGVGNKNWVMRDIANTLIVLPPLAEQKRIVSFFTTMLPLIRAIGSV